MGAFVCCVSVQLLILETFRLRLLIVRLSAVCSDTPHASCDTVFVELMANNKLRPRARQHEQIVCNKGPTACRMALEKMLGATCLVPLLPDTTADMWLAVIISPSCQLTPVISVIGHMVLTVWCW